MSSSHSSSRLRPTNLAARPCPPRGRRGARIRRSSLQTTPPSFPLASTVRGFAELERAADEGRGALPHECAAGLRRLFEARGHVHRVAGRERAALARAADHDLAGVHADPQREPAAEELLQPLLHPESDLQRPLGVVLLGRGRAEHGDDRVADELLDRSAAERDLRFHRVVEAVEQVARVLRVERRAQLRRADEVGEQDRCELALHWASISRTSHKSLGAHRRISRPAGGGLPVGKRLIALVTPPATTSEYPPSRSAGGR